MAHRFRDFEPHVNCPCPVLPQEGLAGMSAKVYDPKCSMAAYAHPRLLSAREVRELLNAWRRQNDSRS